MLFRSNIFFKGLLSIFFLTYFVLGLFIYKDYGITTDEEFQRYSGFYWLNYILSFSPFEGLQLLVDRKLSSIGGFTLPNPEDYPFYGVIFDLPLALIETILKIEDPRQYFLLRHKLNFIIFFISSIYFYKIAENRFKNKSAIFFGVLIYIGSPRIFGDSFFNNKDIIFLSLITISLYYSLKLLSDFRSKNILLFSIFSALASAARIVGIFLPLSIISVLVFENLGKKFKKEFLLKIFSLFFLYILFLIIFWPYLWESPFENFIRSFSVFSNYVVNIEFLYSGDYISSKSLPYSYILKWIFISTPIIILIFFIIGYLVGIKKIISRTLNIEKYDNPWSGDAEKKDFYMFVNFSLIVIYLIFSNVVLYNGWRQIYFLHIFIVYSSVYGLVYFDQYFNLPQKFRNITKTICFLFVFMIYAEIYKSHPFQSLFFNNLAPKETHKSYEIDYWGLAGKKFLESIISFEKGNKDKITIGVASWVPLHRSISMLEPNIRERILIVGQDYAKSKYIFSNNISEINKENNKKYTVPDNFIKINEFRINSRVVYEVFKKLPQ